MSRTARARTTRPPRAIRRAAPRRLPIPPRALVAALAGAYAILFLLVSKARFDTFAFRDQDLALNAQALWALLHGSTHTSIWGVSFLGNHLQWATFVLAPFYLLFPSPLFLLSVQTLALAAGAFPLYRIAERRLGSNLALAVVATYLLYPALGYTNFSEFHMPSLAVPLLLWAHDAWETKRNGTLIALLVAVALIQENFPLFGAAYGVLLFVRRRERVRGLLLAIGCLAYFYAGIELGPRIFWRSAEPVSAGAESVPAVPPFFGAMGRSVPELVANFARDPVGALGSTYEPRKGLWLAHLFLPLALLPLAGVEWLAPAAPYFLQHLLSSRENETSIRSHYAAEMIPFLFIAAVAGMARVRARLPARIGAPLLAGVLLIAVVWGNIALGCQFRLVDDLLHAHEAPPDPVRVRLLKMIPPDASVVATFDVLPHLVNRAELHTVIHVALGTLTRRSFRFRLPDDTRFALVDWVDDMTFRRFNERKLDQKLARTFADGSWRVVHAEGSVTLLERSAQPLREGRGGEGDSVTIPQLPFAGETQLFQLDPPLPSGFRGPRLLFDEALELLEVWVISAPPEEGERIRVSLTWRLRAPVPEPGQYIAKIELIDSTGRIAASTAHPICYNLFPPMRWTPGATVREDVWLTARGPIARGDYGIGLGLTAYHHPHEVSVLGLTDGVAVGSERAIAGVWRFR